MDLLFEDFTEALILGTGKHSSRCASHLRRKYGITPTVISDRFPFLQYILCKRITAPTDNPGILYEVIRSLARENTEKGYETLLVICSERDSEIISALPDSVGDLCVIIDMRHTILNQGVLPNHEA